MTEKKNNSLKWGTLILITGVVLTFAAPLIFTLNYTIVDFKNTGQIGDTIGGITAPFANILGAILVYLALRAQIDANKIVQDQITGQKKDEKIQKQKQFFLDQFKLIREDLASLSITVDEHAGFLRAVGREANFVTQTGAVAIKSILANLRQFESKNPDILNKSAHYNELLSILHSLSKLLTGIEKSDMDQIDKDNIKTQIGYLVDTKLRAAFESNMEYRARTVDNSEGNSKGIPEMLFTAYLSVLERSRGGFDFDI